MSVKLIKILMVVGVLASCTPREAPVANENDTEKLSQQLEGAVLWYQNAAEMRLTYYQSYQYARLLLDQKLAENKYKKSPAVVLDIDETVLDNSPYEGMLIKEGLTYSPDTWVTWTSKAKAETLPGVKMFVNYAMSKQVEVFYISNRTVGELAPTIENLRKEGLPNADSAHVLLKEETSDKTVRRNIVREGHEILVFVGDNLTDYSELYADRDEAMGKDLVDSHLKELLNNFVMLPNPMYGEWEKALYSNNYRQADSTKLKLRKEAIKAY